MRLSSASVKICQIPHVNFETTSQFPLKFCITLQCHERYFLCTVLAQTIYTLLKRSPLKGNFLRLSSAQVKIFQIPLVNFETTSQFLSKSQSLFSVMKDNSSVLFHLKLGNLFRLSTAHIKINQIPHVNFEKTSQFLFKFCITLQCHER